ncbi:ASAH1, partial [Symbiodinium microadriaticum]
MAEGTGRDLDFFECYAGRARLSHAVQEEFDSQCQLFCYHAGIFSIYEQPLASYMPQLRAMRDLLDLDQRLGDDEDVLDLVPPASKRLAGFGILSAQPATTHAPCRLWSLRTNSTRSLGSDATETTSPPASATHFLKGIGQAAMEKALSGTNLESDKKIKKKDKKNKKGPNFCHVRLARIRSLAGQSSDSDEESSTESRDGQEEKQGLFRLLNKELQRSLDQTKVEDLSCQQLAYTLCGIAKCVVASDLVQIGGETVPCSQWMQHAVKTGCQKQVITPAVSRAAMILRSFIGASAELNRVTTKSQAQINISSCKTLDDINTLYKSLVKRHCRKEGISKEAMSRRYDELLSRLCEEAENDLKQLAAGRRAKRSPRAEAASTLKPRRLFADPAVTGSDRGAGEEDDDNDDDDKFAGLSEADGEDGDLFTGRFKQSPAKKASARKPKQSGKRKRALARECPHESSDNEEPDHSKEKDPEQEAFSGNGGIKDRAETSKPEDLKSKFEPGLLELLLPGMNSTDSDHCMSLLLCEDITTLHEAVELFSDVPGGELIQSLGSKARECAQNLTLKARKVLTKWPTMLQEHDKQLLALEENGDGQDVSWAPGLRARSMSSCWVQINVLLPLNVLLRLRDFIACLPVYREFPRLNTEAEKMEHKGLFLKKLAFVDDKISRNLPIVHDQRLSMPEWEAAEVVLEIRACRENSLSSWQEILDSCRQAAARAGLPLRPRLPETAKAAMPSDEQLAIVEVLPDPDEEQPVAANVARADYTPTKSLFMQSAVGHTGVFDVLQAVLLLLLSCVLAESLAEPATYSTIICSQVQGDVSSDGFKLFFRASTLWKMFERRDNLTCELADAWKVNLDLHIIRKLGYKGKQGLCLQRLELQGVTSLRRISILNFKQSEAVCVLQIRSCSEKFQKAVVQSLETLLGNACPPDMELALLPRSNACTLKCVGHDVDLASWETFLQFVEWVPRWQKFKLASSAQQQFNAGVRLSLAFCFIMRANFKEMICGRVSTGRLQKRALHLLAQGAESHLEDRLLNDLPVPTSKDEFHPCKTQLGSVLPGASLGCRVALGEPRDGRFLKKEIKPKHVLQLDRFLGRKAGFATSETCDDQLNDLGLSEFVPSHKHRLSSDFSYRYFRKAATVLHEEMEKLPVKGMAFLCELQSLADKMLQQDASAASKMPRTVGRLKQDRLASREHMRALLHSLELLNLELAPLPFSLRAADPEKHESREMYGSRAFIFNYESGLAEWVCTPDFDGKTKTGVRVTLHPDEGGPLFCAWQFLSSLGLPVGFCRDETHKLQTHFLRFLNAHKDDVLMQMFSEHILKEQGWPVTEDASLNFSRVVQVLDKLMRRTGSIFEQGRLMRATFGEVAVENLGISSDIGRAQNSDGLMVLQVTKRRSPELEDLLLDHVQAGLAALTELRQYKVYLQSSPHQAAALLVECDGGSAEQDTQNTILQAMKLEWSLVIEAENSMKLHRLMQSSCPHTQFVYYREVMSSFEKEGWVLSPSTEALLRAWYPGLSSSCNVEQCFNHMEDSMKRATKANSASLANVQCLGIRAVANKVCRGEKGAQAIALSPEDFEGNEAETDRGPHFRVDDILKNFGSTSAHAHTRVNMNLMKAFLLGKKMLGIDGRLLLHDGKWLLALGKAAGLLYALSLDELHMFFQGPLPAETVDETAVTRESRRLKAQDPLSDGETVKALVVCGSKKPPNCKWPIIMETLLDFQKVQVFPYTMHWVEGSLATKLGSCCLLRRSVAGRSLLLDLILTGEIVKVTSESLSKMLKIQDVSCRKNATKSAKIKALLEQPSIKEAVAQERIVELLAILKDLDDKRRKKKPEDEDEGDRDPCEPEEEVFPDENDEVMMAAAAVVQEMEQAAGSGGEVEKPPPASELPGMDAEQERESRKSISNAVAIPQFLKDRFPMPPDIQVVHVQHRTKTLPHFQAKLPTGMDGWTVEQNTRNPNDWHKNLQALKDAKGDLFGWRVRQVMETTPTYQGALTTLVNAEFIAPMYFIMSGKGRYEGAVVTKDRGDEHLADTEAVRQLSEANGTWYLLQTNDDANKWPEDSRRPTTKLMLAGENQAEVDQPFIWKNIRSQTLVTPITVFTWVADP